ncbi:MAG: hypothetical protein ACXQT0_04755 [Candidatus Methanofastidiosia archaeon]
MSILIVAKKGSKAEVVDETTNRKQAKKRLDHWEKLKGKGWRIFTKTAR